MYVITRNFSASPRHDDSVGSSAGNGEARVLRAELHAAGGDVDHAQPVHAAKRGDLGATGGKDDYALVDVDHAAEGATLLALAAERSVQVEIAVQPGTHENRVTLERAADA